jgi:hypothetical protein
VVSTVNEYVPAVVGVPEITPVRAFRLVPGGSVPLVTANVYGAMPFAATEAVYAAVVDPLGRVCVVITTGGKTACESTARFHTSCLFVNPPDAAEKPNLTVGSLRSAAGAFNARSGAPAIEHVVFAAQIHIFTWGVATVDGSTIMRIALARFDRVDEV